MGCCTSKAEAERPSGAVATSTQATATEQETAQSTPTLLGQEAASAEPKLASEFRIKLGATFPDFDCDTTGGQFSFHEFLARKGSPAWTVLLSYPKDFTPVCTTELAICSNLVVHLAKMGVKLIGLSCDTVSEHKEWSKDVLAVKRHHTGLLGSAKDNVDISLGIDGHFLGFPLIADEKREIATMLGMLDANEKDAAGAPMPARALFIIGPDKTNRATILYPATTGCNFDEVLRVVKSLCLTQDFKLATPGNWKAKDPVIVTPAVTTEEAQEKFGNLQIKELPSGKPYLRYVDRPSELVTQPALTLPPPQAVACAQDFKIKIGASFPDFECKTTEGNFNFHEFLDREPSWTILFSHPKDFTPVSTTELGICDSMAAQFKEQGVKLIGLSCDSLSEHQAWSKDILAAKETDGDGGKLAFPLIADDNREIAARLGMLDPSERDASGIPMSVRALFFIAPDKTNRATILYPATTGCNFEEVLRVVLSLRLTHDLGLATPGNWERGSRVIVTPAVSTEEAQEQFANLEIIHLPSGKPYLRVVDCPGAEPTVTVEPTSDVVQDQGPLPSELRPEASSGPVKEDTTAATQGRKAVSCCC